MIRTTGFTYLDFHSSEFEIRITNIENPLPEAKEIREAVPHMNGDYDFTDRYGGTKYNNRRITISGFVMPDNEVSLFRLKREIERWLIGRGWNKLELDYEEEFEYTAKCMNCSPVPDVSARRLNITIEFEAKPYAVNKIDGSVTL